MVFFPGNSPQRENGQGAAKGRQQKEFATGPNLEQIQDRLKFSISLENFNLA